MQKFKGYRIEMYPTKEQEKMLLEYCRASRYCYNWGLFKHNEIYEKTGRNTTSNQLCKLFTEFKNSNKSDVCIWLQSFKATALRIAVRNVSMEFKKCFKRRKTTGNKSQNGLPKPITKKSGHNFFFTRKERMFIYDNYISFEGFTTKDNNMILIKNHNIPHDKKYNYCDPCISQDKLGRWWFSCEISYDKPREINKYQIPGKVIGIDLGIKTFVTTSDNKKYNYPKKSINRLTKKKKRIQRRLSKTYEKIHKAKTKPINEIEKSSNTLKLEKHLQKVQNKINNIRKNTRYDIVNKILNENPRAVVMEGLNVTGMMKNRHLSTKIQDNSFYDFRRIMEYKCEWNDIEFILADQWFPSSKKCSNCGDINKELTIKQRVFKCKTCGYVIDRDLNAAINLKKLATIVI